MTLSREIITLHFGQAGIQIGNAVWETMVAEHNIKADGLIDSVGIIPMEEENAIKTFFHLSPTSQFIPRALIVDTEPTVIDEIRSGFYRKLFHPDLLLSGIDDASNNFARGYFTIGRRMLYRMLEKIRYIIESCDNLKGFMSFSGSGGGTGSGLYSLFLDRIMLEFSTKTVFGTLILPGRTMNNTVVDPYNSVFGINHSTASNINMLMDNESMYKICHDKLNFLHPTYANLNRIIAPIFTTITAPSRFHGPLTSDLSEIATNLIPFPSINFPTISYSPFITADCLDHTLLNSGQLILDVFHPDFGLLGLDLKKGKFMSSVLIFRGQHQMNAIIDQLNHIRKENLYQWVDWCPTGFKVTQSLHPVLQSFTCQPQRSVLMMCNHSEVTKSLNNICQKFSLLFKKRSFVHWYIGEGMEMDEMVEATNNVSFIVNDYDEVCKSQKDVEEANPDKTEANELTVSLSKVESENIASKSQDIASKKENIGSKSENIATKSDESSGKIKENFSQNSEVDQQLEPNISQSLKHDQPSTYNSSRKSEIDQISTMKVTEHRIVSEEYEMTAKTKEILLNNVTTLGPALRQRLLGFVE